MSDTTPNSFASDNVTPACAEVLQAIVTANAGIQMSYGSDEYSCRLKDKLSEVFETDLEVFPTVTGTASNALALAALTPSYGKIYCHELAHINTDECGAPEHFTGGAKLIDMQGDHGKISAQTLQENIYGRGNVHHAQPATVSITQACESGCVYQLDEITAISETAHAHGLNLHMDGARFANALVSLDVSPATMTWKSGVDVLSFGGTKNGCLAAEVVIFFNTELVKDFAYLHKRSGQLLSKMRFVAAQLEAYLSNDVWLRNARHANAMAKQLSHGLARIPSIELAYPTQSNEVFAHIPQPTIESLNNEGFALNVEELDGSAIRFVTAWNTDVADINRLLSSILKVTP